MLSEPKVNVLLVDDHPENLLALEAILDSLGQNLVKATSGGQALRCLLNQDFAVILLDVQMPDMDGFETAELIRQRERSRYTPIIFLTAFSTSDNMVFKGYSVGAVDYLFKPIEPEILKSKVAAFVDLFQKTAEVKRQAAQLQAMNAELRKREEMFRSLSACSPVGIFLTNKEGKCTYSNLRYQAIYGITLEDSLGEGWTQKIHPEDREGVIADWYNASSAGQEYKGEFRIFTSEGVERWVDMRSSGMLSDKGEVIGYVGTLEDITERKQAQEEHIQLIREQTARQEAETANRLKDEFLATLSHELRTPLSSILGWAKLLRQRKFDEKTIERGLETIQRNASLQAQLINDILDVSQIIRGKLNLNFCPVNLLSVIAAAMDTVRLEAEAKSIDFRFSVLDCELDEERSHAESIDSNQQLDNLKSKIQNPKFCVFGDANRLQQILWNLLSNAIKFTPSGGHIEVLISIVGISKDEEKFEPHQMLGTSQGNGKYREVPKLETAAINSSSATKYAIDGDLGGNYVQIQVSDTGIGISPDFLPLVFDRFRQADGSITRNHGGLGLGLAIVRHLVEMHKGSVHAESSGVGKGAKFTVKLPLLKAGKPLSSTEVGIYHASGLQG
ncbi:MAG: ATP-binding protein [Heteroscytonema crispum UTEX LB 1556]